MTAALSKDLRTKHGVSSMRLACRSMKFLQLWSMHEEGMKSGSECKEHA